MRKLSLSILAAAITVSLWVGFSVAHRTASAESAKPTEGWTVHIDAQKHFSENPNEVAHHFCKNVAGGWLECQIYDGDGSDAHLVSVEAIVSPAIYKSLPANEQALWHWHKTEIPKVNATMPDTPPDEQKKMIASMSDTYGKVYVIFDPITTHGLPIGTPTITVLK